MPLFSPNTGIKMKLWSLKYTPNTAAAVELNPSYTLAYFNAGRASQAMGFINDAANYYQMAIDLNKITQDLDEEDIQTRLHKLFDI